MYKYDILEKENLLKREKRIIPNAKKLKYWSSRKERALFSSFTKIQSTTTPYICTCIIAIILKCMLSLILLKWLCVPIQDHREKKTPLCSKAPVCKNAISNEKQANGKDLSSTGEEPSLGDTDLLGGTVSQRQDQARGSVQMAERKPRGRRH